MLKRLIRYGWTVGKAWEAVTRILKFICYVIDFVLTSIGLTCFINSQLRELVFQIFG